MSKVIDPRVCPVCGDQFTPIPRRDGSLPEACRQHIRKWNARGRKGQVPEAAVAARREDAALRLGVMLADRFGELTFRERQIFQVGLRKGYDRGYSRAHHERKARVA